MKECNGFHNHSTLVTMPIVSNLKLELCHSVFFMGRFTVNPLLIPPFQGKKVNKPPLSIKHSSPLLSILHYDRLNINQSRL